MRVLHVITGLNVGGAEMMLKKLVQSHADMGVSSEVVSLTDIGKTGKQLQALGITVTALDMPRGTPSPRGLFRLVRYIKGYRPDVIQSWMYHADLLAGIAGKLAGGYPVVWNIRHSNLDPVGNKKLTFLTARACARLSRRLPKRIICCSEASRYEHARLGYDDKRMQVVPNGFDTGLFRPDETARNAIRREIDIRLDDFVVGIVGRYDPQKDYPNFIDAAGILLRERGNVMFVMVGKGIDRENRELAKKIRECGVEQRVRLLGEREDMEKVTCAFDMATSASRYGEGFPNAIGEAMSCGIPCVVTDVGDSRLIVGDTGKTVVPGDPEALAGGWRALMELDKETRTGLGQRARRRIEQKYGIAVVAEQYRKIYQEEQGIVRD